MRIQSPSRLLAIDEDSSGSPATLHFESLTARTTSGPAPRATVSKRTSSLSGRRHGQVPEGPAPTPRRPVRARAEDPTNRSGCGQTRHMAHVEREHSASGDHAAPDRKETRRASIRDQDREAGHPRGPRAPPQRLRPHALARGRGRARRRGLHQARLLPHRRGDGRLGPPGAPRRREPVRGRLVRRLRPAQQQPHRRARRRAGAGRRSEAAQGRAGAAVPSIRPHEPHTHRHDVVPRAGPATRRAAARGAGLVTRTPERRTSRLPHASQLSGSGTVGTGHPSRRLGGIRRAGRPGGGRRSP